MRQVRVTVEPASEPVTVAEVKNYARIDYTTDDTLIGIIITNARKQIEAYTGVGLGSQTVEYIFSTSTHNEEVLLPYRPFNTMTALTYQSCRLSDANDILTDTDDWDVSANRFTGDKGIYRATYTGGYSTIPADLKLAVLIQCAYDYENRANGASGICKQAIEKARPYKVNVWGI